MNVYAIDNTTHDMFVANGMIARRSGSEAIMQTLKTRLLLVRQEWFMDLSAGLPWYTKMTGKNPSLYKIRAYVASEIIQTDGVQELKSLELLYNNAERKMDINFAYVDIYGSNQEGVV